MDGLQFYGHDLKNDSESFSKHMKGDQLVTAWDAFSFDRKAELVGADGRMDSDCYIQGLGWRLFPAADALLRENWTL